MENKINLTWDDIHKRAIAVAKDIEDSWAPSRQHPIKLYGIPRGGIPAVQAVFACLKLVTEYVTISEFPEIHTNCICIDDIIDTGSTRKKFQSKYHHIPFYALVDKECKDKDWRGKWISFPWERMKNDDAPVENIRRLLEYLGEDPERDGLKETPERVIKSFGKLFGGYKQEPKKIFKVFEEPCDEMVIVKDIEFYSTCEHHWLPFYGRAHIAYIPKGKVIGVSKLARLLEIYSRRLQIQERICQQVTQALEENLKPIGAACILEAQHLCMVCRGVEKQHSVMITSSLTGAFKEKPEARAELMSMIK